MGIHSVALHNKTGVNIYANGIGIPIDKIGTIPASQMITNLDITLRDSSIKNIRWLGSVPSSTFLEVYKNDDGFSVYLDDEKIPQHIITDPQCTDESCSSGKCGIKGIAIVIIIILAIMLILFF